MHDQQGGLHFEGSAAVCRHIRRVCRWACVPQCVFRKESCKGTNDLCFLMQLACQAVAIPTHCASAEASRSSTSTTATHCRIQQSICCLCTPQPEV